MLRSESLIESELGKALGAPVKACVAGEGADPRDLSAGEQRRLAEIQPGRRVTSWLRGRAALKQILATLGEDQDTAEIGFPSRRLSLSHSGDVAIAVASLDSSCSGIGIDLELGAGPSPAAARLFLDDGERESLGAHLPEHVLRLWTVKEALFKANPENRQSWFTDYRIRNPRESAGSATFSGAISLDLRYASFAVDGGYLTIASSRLRGESS